MDEDLMFRCRAHVSFAHVFRLGKKIAAKVTALLQ